MKHWHPTNIIELADEHGIPLGSAPSKEQLVQFFWSAFAQGAECGPHMATGESKPSEQPLEIAFHFDRDTTYKLAAYAVNCIIDKALKPIADSEVKE